MTMKKKVSKAPKTSKKQSVKNGPKKKGKKKMDRQKWTEKT